MKAMCKYRLPKTYYARKEIGIDILIAPKPVFVFQIIVRQLDRLNTISIYRSYVYSIWDHQKVSLIITNIFFK